MTSNRIQFFGNPRFTRDGVHVKAIDTSRLQSLLAFLVLRAATPQSREQLASLLWPDSSEGQARTNLRQLIHHLRRALPAGSCFLIADNHTVQWPRNPSCVVDVHEFDETLKRASEAERSGNLAEQSVALLRAEELYQDELARGLFDDWLKPLREHYRQQFGLVLGKLSALLEEQGDLAGSIRRAERLVSHDPLRDAHHQLLIRLHIVNRDRAGALRAYHQCVRILRRELGVDPDPATAELYQRALKSEALVHQRVTPQTIPASGNRRIVGRQAEFTQLRNCWQVVESGKTHLAVIVGEPGIGKSRLAEELYEWCASDRQSVVAKARCYAAQGQLAYAPIAEWLRAEPFRTTLSKLPSAQVEELARVLPEILASNSSTSRTSSTERWERRRFFEALLSAFSRIPHPALLWIDDLQWCDQDSLEYLTALFRSSQTGSFLVLATLRDEGLDRNHPATQLRVDLARTGQLTEIRLQPLNPAETSTLATQISNQLMTPSDLAELYRTTQGNPLFVVESIREGSRTPDGTRRIHAVISARLAQLSASGYELAGLAATVGQSFSFDLLAKASDWDEDSLSKALDELWRHRLIEGLDGAQYDFTHDRIREVAQAELSPIRRRFFHRRIARALDESNADGSPVVSLQLAAHYDDAGMPYEAITHYRHAATVAQQRFADKEAAALLRRALTLCQAFPDSTKRDELELEILVTLGPMLVRTQGYAMPEVGDTYQRALELSRRLREKTHLPFILSGLWVFRAVRGDVRVARLAAQELMDLAVTEASPALTMAADFTLGSSLFHMGELELSRQHLARTVSQYGQVAHSALALFAGPDLGVFCRSYLSHLLWHQGHPDLAVQSLLDALHAASRIGHPFSVAIAMDYGALLYAFQRDTATALEYARNAIAICQKHDFAYYRSIAEIVAGWASAFEEDPLRGITQLRAGLELFKSTGAEIRLPFYYGLLAEACALNGNIGEALANLSSAFAFQNKNGEIWSAADLHRVQGDLFRESGNGASARSSYRRSIEAARQVGSVEFESRAEARLNALTQANRSGSG